MHAVHFGNLPPLQLGMGGGPRFRGVSATLGAAPPKVPSNLSTLRFTNEHCTVSTMYRMLKQRTMDSDDRMRCIGIAGPQASCVRVLRQSSVPTLVPNRRARTGHP